MSKRCYFRKGDKELVWGTIHCDTLVADESQETELLAQGWKRSPLDLEEKKEAVSEVVQTLRDTAKERGIKGWHLMGEAKLREALGLNDGDQE